MKAENMLKPVDIIIPTYDNREMLMSCLRSLIKSAFYYQLRIIVVNNGEAVLEPLIETINEPLRKLSRPEILLLNAKKNLGWTGGLRLGLEHSETEFVCFANDDIFIPPSQERWLQTLIREMILFDNIGAVGPSSNIVSGKQNIFDMEHNTDKIFTSYLIGFCILIRRKALDEVGGVQDMQYGGDDFDLSIRLRKANYLLHINRNSFVYHHGFVTGHKVHGTPDKPNGWNSQEMIDNTNMELIRKHGFRWVIKTFHNVDAVYFSDYVDAAGSSAVDEEGDEVRKYINGGGKILELGCGYKKTLPHVVGVDIIPKGQLVRFSTFASEADVVTDVTKPLPFDDEQYDCVIGRHILEHCVDTVQTLKNWIRPLKNKGRMILALPDERMLEGVTLNQEHVHAFTPDSLRNLGEAVGLKYVDTAENFNNNSFVMCFEK